MSDRARPMLAPVLVALTGVDPHRVGDADGFDDLELTATRARWAWGGYLNDMPWVERDPLAALELLEVRDLAPPRDERRGFAVDCRHCDKGTVTITTGDGSFGTLEPAPCERCEGTGQRVADHPTTLADLVSVYSLGATVVDAEELAVEMCQRLAPWGATPCERVVWRVGEFREPVDCDPDGWPAEANGVTRSTLFEAAYARGRRLCEPFSLVAAEVEVWPKDASLCPYDPLLRILRMGLAVDSITSGTVTLVVPPVGGG